jgi:hypothetical protein
VKKETIVRWLLDGDPAIRWQTLRDLAEAPAEEVAAERSRVAGEGWGARVLALQTEDGYWQLGRDDDPWMTTLYALDLLKQLGVDPDDARVRDAIARLRTGLNWSELDGRPYFEGETEVCVNGRILGAGAYFGERCEALLERLLSEQLEDGGWNCEAPPSKRSSFHSTICVLEGLLEYELRWGETPASTQALRRGQEYLLERRLLRSKSSGEMIDRRWLRFSFPTLWHYDVLRGLDYLRDAGVDPEERMTEAIAVVEQRRHQNGRWPQNLLHPNRRLPFDLEPEVGRASRWNTLRALRVLAWHRHG